MAQIQDSNGNTTIRQGDTWYIHLVGIDPTLGGEIYAQVINQKRKPMFTTEPYVSISGLTAVDIEVDSSLTDLLTVGKNEDYEVYYYVIKHVKDGKEDTWFLGDNRDFGVLPELTVYPKVAEG